MLNAQERRKQNAVKRRKKESISNHHSMKILERSMSMNQWFEI